MSKPGFKGSSMWHPLTPAADHKKALLCMTAINSIYIYIVLNIIVLSDKSLRYLFVDRFPYSQGLHERLRKRVVGEIKC